MTFKEIKRDFKIVIVAVVVIFFISMFEEERRIDYETKVDNYFQETKEYTDNSIDYLKNQIMNEPKIIPSCLIGNKTH